jgi:hypothetical protein
LQGVNKMRLLTCDGLNSSKNSTTVENSAFCDKVLFDGQWESIDLSEQPLRSLLYKSEYGPNTVTSLSRWLLWKTVRSATKSTADWEVPCGLSESPIGFSKWIRIRARSCHVASSAIQSQCNGVYNSRTFRVHRSLVKKLRLPNWRVTSCLVCDFTKPEAHCQWRHESPKYLSAKMPKLD